LAGIGRGLKTSEALPIQSTQSSLIGQMELKAFSLRMLLTQFGRGMNRNYYAVCFVISSREKQVGLWSRVYECLI